MAVHNDHGRFWLCWHSAIDKFVINCVFFFFFFNYHYVRLLLRRTTVTPNYRYVGLSFRYIISSRGDPMRLTGRSNQRTS